MCKIFLPHAAPSPHISSQTAVGKIFTTALAKNLRGGFAFGRKTQPVKNAEQKAALDDEKDWREKEQSKEGPRGKHIGKLSKESKGSAVIQTSRKDSSKEGKGSAVASPFLEEDPLPNRGLTKNTVQITFRDVKTYIDEALRRMGWTRTLGREQQAGYIGDGDGLENGFGQSVSSQCHGSFAESMLSQCRSYADSMSAMCQICGVFCRGDLRSVL